MFKRKWIITVMMVVGLYCGGLLADDITRKADHEALRALKDKVIKALNNRDIKLLNSCFASDFVFTSINQATLTSAAQVEDFFQQTFDGPDSMLESMKCKPNADILTRFIDANSGYCYGSNEETYKLKDGREVVQQARWTAVVVKENGEWKIAAAHAGVDFLDNPVLNHAMGMGYKLLIYGFIAGLIVALLVMFVMRKLRAKPATQ
jgi:ketosteroid isomerase-like protein